MININIADIPVLPISLAEVPTVEVNLCDTVIETVPGSVFDGDYEVTPQAHDETVLATQGKLMSKDVTVHRVPYYETSNTYGQTVYIAEELLNG